MVYADIPIYLLPDQYGIMARKRKCRICGGKILGGCEKADLCFPCRLAGWRAVNQGADDWRKQVKIERGVVDEKER